MTKTTNVAALLSLILSIIGLVGGLVGCCVFGICLGPLGFVLGLIGAILGYIARQQIAQSGGLQSGEEMATIGLILGIITAVLGILVVVLNVFCIGVYATLPFILPTPTVRWR